jgi:hypothetical protein
MFVAGVIWYFVQKHFHPDTTDPASFQRLLIFFGAFLVIDFIASTSLSHWSAATPNRAKTPGCSARSGCSALPTGRSFLWFCSGP